MVESEQSPKSASYETLEKDLELLSAKLEELLDENQALDDTHCLPVTEFTVTPRRVAALQDQLLQQESGVVREVERERLLRLLQCHHLKNASWDSLEVKSRSLFCISSEVSVKNYPVEVPRAEAWRKVLAAHEEKKRVRSFKTSISPDDFADEDEYLLLELTEGEYKELLYPQLDLTCREKVEKQLVLITFMTRRLQDAFNARFDAAHQRKGRVIEEVHRLTRRERQLKPLGEWDLPRSSLRPACSLRWLAGLKGPWHRWRRLGWKIRDRGSGLRGRVSLVHGNHPTTATICREDSIRCQDDGLKTDQRSSRHKGMAYVCLGLRRQREQRGPAHRPPWLLPLLLLRRCPFNAHDPIPGLRQFRRHVGGGKGGLPLRSPPTWRKGKVAQENRSHMQLQKPRQDWTWAEARAWREWRTAQEEEQRRRRAHATTLTLQLERIRPTIKSLMQEFDSQVKALVDSRVATDEALLIYALVAARLQLRLFRQEELEARLASLQEQRSQAEAREEQMAEEEETTRREEARAKAKQERLQDQLKEEETALRRTIINLPIDQYNHLLALYNKRTSPSSRYLDLPSARGGHHGGGDASSIAPPLSPTGGGPLSPSGVSPAPSESGASGRRGSTRPSRPASGASHTDELRSGEDQMPEGLAGGARTWRQFLRYRRRRQDLLEEADDATTKRATASAHLHTLDAQRNALRQELAQLEAAVAEGSQELRLVDEDMELVLLLQSGQVKMDLDGLTKSLQPDFQGTRLLQGRELALLNALAEKCGDIRDEGEEEEDDTAEKDEELETLRTLKGQLELQAELVQQELHQINTFKVGRDVISAAADVVEGGEQQDSTQLYGSLQRLQQVGFQDET
ncbi:uncharacterized protein LOC125039222 [Penaeus chinensis]|uniref:uncharacterized protein LOC125039222 n=1 Tax=Penaeus chinensis TaxID=139456 RepID=UPI001FB6077D|nr:uncharacterized protein LOC125039222 [Penaeus chinensis]